jgi:CRISPR-associated endonuclease Csn1
MVDIKSNKDLYATIKERLEEFKNDPKKAFENPIYFKKKDGTNINVIKKISVYEDSIAVVPVRNGVACNGDLLRLDVFKSDEGYVVSPIYVNDFLAKKLPETYLSNSLEYPIDPSWPFVLTIHKNDFIELTSFKKSSKTLSVIRGFYNTFNRFGSSIHLLDITELIQDMDTGEITTNYYDEKRYGLKTLENISKYEVNLLGEKYLVKEKRNPFN